MELIVEKYKLHAHNNEWCISTKLPNPQTDKRTGKTVSWGAIYHFSTFEGAMIEFMKLLKRIEFKEVANLAEFCSKLKELAKACNSFIHKVDNTL